jgi:pantothenate kinase
VRELTEPQALARAVELAAGGRRVLLGITGPPGAGKSTLARQLLGRVDGAARLVGMDGFHLAQRELERLGRAERKGAPDTFDAAGYVALLRRLRDQGEDVVYAPVFERALEEPIANAVAVPRDVPLVVTEGNYLLVQEGDWAHVRPLLDEVWYVGVDDDVRRTRLVQRHAAFGKSLDAARAWALGPDERNAVIIEATRERADVVVRCAAAIDRRDAVRAAGPGP